MLICIHILIMFIFVKTERCPFLLLLFVPQTNVASVCGLNSNGWEGKQDFLLSWRKQVLQIQRPDNLRRLALLL